MKGIGLWRELELILPHCCVFTIYKSFIRNHLGYSDVIYDQPSNDSLWKIFESVQYRPALAITGTIRSTSCENLYQELGFEFLHQWE